MRCVIDLTGAGFLLDDVSVYCKVCVPQCAN